MDVHFAVMKLSVFPVSDDCIECFVFALLLQYYICVKISFAYIGPF